MDNEVDYESLPPGVSTSAYMLSGAAAGVFEHATMYPVDCIKTRLQSVQQTRYSGIINAFGTIGKQEGYLRLFRGMSAMVIGAGPAHAMFFACYETVKYHATLKINGKKWKNSSLANMIAGGSATIFHDMVMNPADVIKQRMQMHSSPYKSIGSCMVDIYQREGIRAFYRSFPTQLLMNIPFQTVHFMVYELAQEEINPTREYSPLTHIISGGLAGGCAAFITNPLDVCRTLLNTQQYKFQGDKKFVTGIKEAGKIVFKTDGVSTFFRGVSARVIYQMPSTAISWSVYEFFKHTLYTSGKYRTNDESVNTLRISSAGSVMTTLTVNGTRS